MKSRLCSFIALLTALAFLITSCSWTKEISRKTVRVEKEHILAEAKFDKPDLSMKHEGQYVKINTQGTYIVKVKETDIEEVDFKENKRKKKILTGKFVGNIVVLGILTCGVVLALAIIIVPIMSMIPPPDSASDIRYYTETERGKERTVEEEITIPVKDVLLVVKVNEFEQSLRSNHDGKAELDLLSVINKFDGIPNQLRIICIGKIKDKSAAEELTISESEVIRIALSETGRPQLPSNLVARVNFEKSGGTLQPGSADKLIVTVSNRGRGEAYQLKGTVICPDPLLDGKEVVYGRLDPGKTKKAYIPVAIPKDFPSKTLPIEIHFSEYNKYAPKPVETYLRIGP